MFTLNKGVAVDLPTRKSVIERGLNRLIQREHEQDTHHRQVPHIGVCRTSRQPYNGFGQHGDFGELGILIGGIL